MFSIVYYSHIAGLGVAVIYRRYLKWTYKSVRYGFNLKKPKKLRPSRSRFGTFCINVAHVPVAHYRPQVSPTYHIQRAFHTHAAFI